MRSRAQRVAPFFLILLTVAIALPPCIGQAPQQRSNDLPRGWFVYADEKLKNATEHDTRCFNLSRNEWKVSAEAGGTRIAENSRGQVEAPALPRLIHQEDMTRLQSVTRVNDGWLLAYDGGEFGGGLWLTNDDGSDVRRISNRDVRAVVMRDDGVLILSGLVHIVLDSGDASFYALPHNMNMALQWSIKLDGAPTAYAQQSGAVIVATTHSLDRLTTSGHLEVLHEFPSWIVQQYANSMAISADGSIYIGMRMFVLRLKDQSGEYSEEWLLPDECRRFTLNESKLKCVCKH